MLYHKPTDPQRPEKCEWGGVQKKRLEKKIEKV